MNRFDDEWQEAEESFLRRKAKARLYRALFCLDHRLIDAVDFCRALQLSYESTADAERIANRFRDEAIRTHARPLPDSAHPADTEGDDDGETPGCSDD